MRKQLIFARVYQLESPENHRPPDLTWHLESTRFPELCSLGPNFSIMNCPSTVKEIKMQSAIRAQSWNVNPIKVKHLTSARPTPSRCELLVVSSLFDAGPEGPGLYSLLVELKSKAAQTVKLIRHIRSMLILYYNTAQQDVHCIK